MDIENRRRQLSRQRKEIQSLQKAGISTASAEELLGRMIAKLIELLCAERDHQLDARTVKYPGTNKVINGASGRRVR